jgi:hypothetical protein
MGLDELAATTAVFRIDLALKAVVLLLRSRKRRFKAHKLGFEFVV